MNSFRTAVAPAPDPIQTALTLRAKGRLQEALDTLVATREFSADFYILRGDLQRELGQIRDAAESYATVTDQDPDRLYAQSQLGACRYRLQQWESAVQAFQAVLRFDPHRDEIRLALADCLLRLQRFGLAMECFDQCWSDASRPRALFGKAVALQLLRRYDEAEKHYERLLAIDPSAEEALANLIAMSMEVFELARVQEYSQRLLGINNRSTIALQGLALAAIERRDYPVAASYFFQLSDMNPEIMRPPAQPSPAVEYRISQKVFETLEDARRKQKSKSAHASGGDLPR